MWIISKTGFVSLVEHATDPDMLRARARRAEHLTGTFPIHPDEVIDLGAACPDYRYHANVDRAAAAAVIANAVLDIDYSSHVKEEVSGADDVMYSAMLSCWTALHRLQDPPSPAADWWNAKGYTDADFEWEQARLDTEGGYDDEDVDPDGGDEDTDPPTLDGIVAQVYELADRMRATYGDASSEDK